MRSGFFMVLATLALWSVSRTPAQACTCPLPDYNRSYQNADHVLPVSVLHAFGTAHHQRWYLAVTVGEDFKGCIASQSRVLLTSASNSANCGLRLDVGEKYLLLGRDAGRRFGLQVLEVGRCDTNSAWASVEPAQMDFLNTRYKCCGEECGCLGSTPVQCFANPCEVSRCGVDGATCGSNYCGGCHAEWTDPSGARVCLPNDPCADPERDYRSRDPEQCSVLRFVCEPGQEAFFDDCGCGCKTQRPTLVEPCRTGGCSGQLCLGSEDEDLVTTCEFRPEYSCYHSATCAPQTESGRCGWSMTRELEACIEDAQTQSNVPVPVTE
jgi:hypothetical protein